MIKNKWVGNEDYNWYKVKDFDIDNQIDQLFGKI